MVKESTIHMEKLNLNFSSTNRDATLHTHYKLQMDEKLTL